MDAIPLGTPDLVEIVFEPHARAAAFCILIALVIAIPLAFSTLKR